jgi:hypothetical protein
MGQVNSRRGIEAFGGEFLLLRLPPPSPSPSSFSVLSFSAHLSFSARLSRRLIVLLSARICVYFTSYQLIA